ncbi:filamentous hemagglutinin [Acinetobacter sp. ANC 4558]|uniref:two-partner secretion domain-containing protein n=1 Tax=Acinetobacter sp. ANC 4558 TaxID=1977876 RepID=UPI000A33CD34|nr:filamentous hemagglutinin N-terminal domain-containing protein [Acinetobacter sp. ANC 4558]OTG86196.1 filamentous hemagglutinin [Acinetobacter sp. ANC 4558]
MKDKQNFMKLNPLAVSILLALPAVASAADIGMVNGRITSANGVPIIDINQANGNGISHNVYDKLNVGKEGLIFNNSQNGANTVLGGQIAGNSNLASGTASIILNEVTSRNSSTLNGMMEVAGDKAHLIIANPNGITCNGCGFINSEKVTMTTGTPNLENDTLNGFSVNGGTITVNGLTNDSPTAILSRAIVVSGDLRVADNELTLIAGTNLIDAENQVKGSVGAQGARRTYGIDVARLGGMYANKINLISTESGVGVRNAGTLVGGQGGIQIDTNGRLINSNARIMASGAIDLKTNGTLDNTTGKIVSNNAVSIDTRNGAITNTRAGNIMSDTNVLISSGRLDNTNGKIAAAQMVAINTNNAELMNTGKGKNVGIEAGIVALETGKLNNRNGQIQGFYVGTQSSSVDNRNGSIESNGDIDISSAGTVDNTSGLIRSGLGHVRIAAAGSRLINNNTRSADTASKDALGIIAGAGGVQLVAANLENTVGQIASAGNIDISASNHVNNYKSRIISEGITSILAATLTNSQSGINGKTGVNVNLTGNLTNSLAIISADEGNVNIQANNISNTAGVILGEDINLNAVNNINNDTGFIAATNNLAVNAGNTVTNANGSNFGHHYGIFLGMTNQQGGMVARNGIEINSKSLNNYNSRIVAENGALNLNIIGALLNDRSLLTAGNGASSIKAASISSDYSTVYSKGDLIIDTGTLSLNSSGNIIDNNATGIIATDGALTLNVANNFTNNGWISSKENLNVNVQGTLTNRNAIHSEKELSVTANRVNNSRNMVGDTKITVNATDRITNTGNLFSEGTADINASRIQNNGRNSVLGGRQGLELHGNTVTGSGIVVGL